jgi:multiple sugar transport system ATP-binding protein
MTVHQNMAFGLKVRGFAAPEIESRIQKAAGILALTPLLSRYPKELSGGQRQRVAMGRAMVRDPQVFLFDEPLSNLDAKLRVAMRTEIKALHQRLGTTTVYVTHDQIEAMTMADRIVIMNGGKIEQIGSPMDVYNRPANQFVAGFIGSPAMNFITGRLSRAGGVSALLVEDGNSIKLPCTSIALEEGAPLVLGLRPEHLGVASSATSESLPGRVLVTEPSGATTQVVSVYAGHQVSAMLPEYREFRRDEPVHLVPDMRQIHLFDSKGARVEAH